MFGHFNGLASRRSGALAPIALVAVLLLSVTVPGVRAVPGDADGNDTVNLQDAALALRIAAGLTSASALAMQNGDVAGPSGNAPDAKISVVDAVRIARGANGLDPGIGGPPVGGSGAFIAKVDTVTISGPTTRNYQLEGAAIVTGTVTDTSGQSISSMSIVGTKYLTTDGTIEFQHASYQPAYGAADLDVGATAFSLPAKTGQNQVTVMTEVSEMDITTFQSVSYTVVQEATPSVCTVTGNNDHFSFVRPNLPAPGALSGNLTSTDFSPTYAEFSLDNGGSGSAVMSGPNYALTAPPGAGELIIDGRLVGDPSVALTLTLKDKITVPAGGSVVSNASVPALYAVTGPITAPAGRKAVRASMTTTRTDQDSLESSCRVATGAQTFKLAMPPGTHDLRVELDQQAFGGAILSLSHTQPVTVAAGANTKTVVLPALPGNVVFSGTVTGPDNAPVPGAYVIATGALSNGYSAFAGQMTTPTGGFALTLPPGAYTIVVSPPDPDDDDDDDLDWARVGARLSGGPRRGR